MKQILFLLTTVALCCRVNSKEITRDALGDVTTMKGVETGESSCPESGNGIEFEELNQGIKNGTFVIMDVRPKNYTTALGMIPSSISIPFSKLTDSLALSNLEFQKRFGISKPDTSSSNLVISCQIGFLAEKAWLEVFKPLNYCNARVYYGSFEDWIQKGGEVVFPPKID